MIEKVLVADDDPLSRRFVETALKRLGKKVVTAENGSVAIEKLKKESFDLVITDLKMPGHTGLDVMLFAKKYQPELLCILVTAHGTVESAVDAMKQGAFNYLLKPFSFDVLESAIIKASEHKKLLCENEFLREMCVQENCPNIIAESPQMKRLLKDIKKVARSNASVFITGESGTGKEVIGTYIHRLSEKANNAFIKVNCAAVPETLVESEFFGHEKGAFTGALQRKIGRFELADKGTLLLDEVTEIPINLQPKLLRAIQEQEFERVGGTHPIQINTRFLATSNRDMQEAIETKVFREDLYYRLNVVPIHIPPLRERPEDILPLAQYFLKKFCKENHKSLKTFTKKAEQKLISYSWPGNVRELGNIIERTVVLDFDSHIDETHLYLDSRGPLREEKVEESLPKGISLHELEKRFILQTLEMHHQNRSKTASSLGISIRTLRNKLHEYSSNK